MCFCSSFWLRTESKAVCAPLKRFCYTGMMTRHMYCIYNCFFPPRSSVFRSSRIGLKKMPSIRETLREMGVSAEQVLTEQDTNNGTVPTPLTNYLDVRHFVHLHFQQLCFFFEGHDSNGCFSLEEKKLMFGPSPKRLHQYSWTRVKMSSTDPVVVDLVL